MIEKIISGEERFQVLANEFTLGPSRENMILMYSADGVNYTAWEEVVPAGENLVVNMAVNGMWYYMKGNNTRLTLKY